ncbi:hypothetical protein RI129_005017 [Pyrocoelia pectoralis]|uniref:Uncharacterized protein n=1 Tax=Pyrocoelia pectoralis TaxID=417401 RepID=A0AAN7ZRE9_9COLE
MKSKVSDKNHNPRKNANLLSVITFAYTIPTFIKGCKRDLGEEDITDHLEEHSSSTLGNRLEKAWRKELAKQNPSLCRAIFKTFGGELILLGLIYAFNQLFVRLAQPLALSQLMKYYSDDNHHVSRNEALMYSGIIVGSNLINILLAHNYLLCLQHLGMKLRVACCSLIYRKSLRLNQSVLDGTTLGRTLNLLSNDVNRCDRSALHFHTLWVCPVQAVMIILTLYYILGLISTIGIFVMIMFVPCQMYLAKKTADLRFKTAITTDKRIRGMNEIICGIQVIKFYTWEKSFKEVIERIRRLEIHYIRGTTFIKGIMISIQLFITKFSLFLTILVYVLTGNVLKADYVFVATAFYDILKQIMTKNFSSGITEIAEAKVSISRIQEFLLSDETQEMSEGTNFIGKSSKEDLTNIIHKRKESIVDLKNGFAVRLDKASAKWNRNTASHDLENINFWALHGQCVALIGPVGGGKSSLLNLILKELPLETGALSVKGRLSYASQEPWLFAGSIKQNIICDQPINLERYERVIKACALDKDFIEMPYGDKTLVGERGVALSGGQKARISLARAIYKKADIYLLDDPFSAVDPHVGKQIFEGCVLKFLKNKCSVIATHQLQYLQYVDQIYFVENGKIPLSGTYQELHSSQKYFSKHLQQKSEDTNVHLTTPVSLLMRKLPFEPSQEKEQRSSGSISKNIYFSYLKASGWGCVPIFLLIIFIIVQLSHSGADYFLTLWVNFEQENAAHNVTVGPLKLDSNSCIYIYSGIVLIMILTTLIGSFGFYISCMKASVNLHNNMLGNIIYAPMKFFNNNSSGRIINRFSKDMGIIDEILPSVALDCLDVGLSILAATVMICFVTPWMALASVVIFVVFYLIRIVYLQTSCDLKRLEGITRSPVFEHMNSTLRGLTTIRAFKSQTIFQQKFDDLQDINSSVWYLYMSCSKAFSFWLDCICVIYIALVTFSFIISKSGEFGGNVGLAITKALALSGRFQWGMRQWSDLENQMTSVERVIEYTKIKKERDHTDSVLPDSWPEKGSISFESVSLRYSETEPDILKSLTFNIKPNEKIGIVGRTGSGKSSLINALFQLVNTEGKIFIDQIDITTVPLDVLRSKICIIPQEPVLFTGTIRMELKNVILQHSLGLDTEVSQDCSNFSIGQRQLLCLARAIVKKTKIIVLDEATANVDHQTDSLIQNTIRKKFYNCTVLTIAHRLNTVMDSDKILVLEGGNVLEFDHPYVLLQNERSIFYSMAQQSGSAMRDALKEVRHTLTRKSHILIFFCFRVIQKTQPEKCDN